MFINANNSITVNQEAINIGETIIGGAKYKSLAFQLKSRTEAQSSE